MYTLYHINDPASFYNKTDAWDIAQEPGAVGGTAASPIANAAAGPTVGPAKENRMDPYYLEMRLPDARSTNFLILQPFVPFSKDDSRKELTAFLIAKSDPGVYGQMEAYVMPRQRQIDGPALVNSTINQDPNVSEQITLLNQSGSKVTLGNMLLIPVKQSLLWVRPLYTEAEGSTPLPQLKKVIVVYGDQVVMEDSLRQALVKLFGDSPPTLEQQGGASTATPSNPTGTPAPGPSPTPTPGQPTVAQLLSDANTHFMNAQNALHNGDLATYQKENDAAAADVQQAGALASGSGTPTPTPTSTPPASTSAPPASTPPTTRVGA
jgi:uncharacterized membrane protein (UPF0182 family)